MLARAAASEPNTATDGHYTDRLYRQTDRQTDIPARGGTLSEI
jgi:hypothetical protein